MHIATQVPLLNNKRRRRSCCASTPRHILQTLAFWIGSTIYVPVLGWLPTETRRRFRTHHGPQGLRGKWELKQEDVSHFWHRSPQAPPWIAVSRQKIIAARGIVWRWPRLEDRPHEIR